MKRNKIIVIIPVYKSVLSDYDRISISRTCEVLASRDIVCIHPEGLDVGEVSRAFPSLEFKSFPKAFFEGIMGYNRMMMSSDFYSAFLDYDYMLVCQTDAYIFRDELDDWCARGYDYVGAPWLRRPVYDNPLLKICMRLSLWYKHLCGRKSKQDLYNKIGNGGLSLRKVSSHYEATIEKSTLISDYLARKKKDHLYNEDVFWATEQPQFRYPSVEEALLFSFDKYPDLCFHLTGGRLPMGCHAWFKRKMKAFWDKHIPA